MRVCVRVCVLCLKINNLVSSTSIVTWVHGNCGGNYPNGVQNLPDHIFSCNPGVLELIYYRTKANQLIYNSEYRKTIFGHEVMKLYSVFCHAFVEIKKSTSVSKGYCGQRTCYTVACQLSPVIMLYFGSFFPSNFFLYLHLYRNQFAVVRLLVNPNTTGLWKKYGRVRSSKQHSDSKQTSTCWIWPTPEDISFSSKNCDQARPVHVFFVVQLDLSWSSIVRQQITCYTTAKLEKNSAG